MIKLGTNIGLQNIVRRLGDASDARATSLERLSSGMRVNRASDDPAGLAFASNLNTDARVLTQGVRNISDGLSALSIADSALAELGNVLLRQRELASQSANGTLSDAQRGALDDELQALASEYERIISTTTFNGNRLFDTSADPMSVQAGYSAIQANNYSADLTHLVGDGTFQTGITVGQGIYVESLELADLNGDGKLDMVFAQQGTNLLIQLGNGNGTFKARLNIVSGNRSYLSKIVLGDTNGDGVTDIITPDTYDNTVSVLLGRGDGTFKSRISSVVTASDSVAIGDFNGDGIQDIAATRTGGVSLLIGNGNGSFNAGVNYAMGDAAVSTADFNNDGNLDLITTDDLQSLNIRLGTGSGTFGASAVYAVAGASVNTRAQTIADFNGDGNLDVATLNRGNATLSILLGNGNGSFKFGVTYASGGPDNSLQIISDDFNNDGYYDLVATNSNRISVLLGNGNGTFRARASYVTGTNPRGVALGDVTGDGVVDLVSADGSGQSFGVLSANTQRTLSLESMDITTTSGALAASDVLTTAYQRVLTARSNVGASQSRFEVALRMLQSTRDGYEEAYSRIMDANVAEESANLIRTNILQQTGVAIAVQANQDSKIALQLLQL